jgi:hypothetical protein
MTFGRMVPEMSLFKGENKVAAKFHFYTENSTKNFFNKEMIVAWVNLKISMSVK